MTTRAERAAEATRLRSEGLIYREIAERMGISPTYAGDLVRDPDYSRVRARKDSYRGTCEGCGARTDGSNGSANAPTICRLCHEGRNDERNRQLIEMWEAGVPTAEIAVALDMSEASVCSWVDHRRSRRGDPIPLRRRPTTSHMEKVAVIEAWEDGWSAAEIVEEFGFASTGSLYQALKEWRRRGYVIPFRLEARG